MFNWEKIKRTWVIKSLLRLLHPSYGRCGSCGLPWSNCKHHTIDVNSHAGFFPVCEYCWQHVSLSELKTVVRDLYYEWARAGYRELSLSEMEEALEKDYSAFLKTHLPVPEKLEEPEKPAETKNSKEKNSAVVTDFLRKKDEEQQFWEDLDKAIGHRFNFRKL